MGGIVNALNQLAKAGEPFAKRAFTPMPGGEAMPMDPAMMGGGGMPMDPAMMGGGGMPMDPAMMGMDPAMMGMDPAMMGGMPPEAAPPPPAEDPAAEPGKKSKQDRLADDIAELKGMMHEIIGYIMGKTGPAADFAPDAQSVPVEAAPAAAAAGSPEEAGAKIATQRIGTPANHDKSASAPGQAAGAPSYAQKLAMLFQTKQQLDEAAALLQKGIQ